jgi:hypothetical protein
MNTTNRKRKPLITAVTLALALAAPLSARAADPVYSYSLPMVFAQALGASGTTVGDFDALISGGLGSLEPRGAVANADAAFAAGEATENDFVARAHSAGFGGAITRSYMSFVIRDPQARGSVKLNVSSKLSATQNKGFKGAVSIGPPPTPNSQSDATVYVRVVPSGSSFMISFGDDGRISALEYPEPPFADNDVFFASAQVQCYYDGPDGAAVVKCDWQKSMLVNNQVVEASTGSGSGVSLNATPTLSVRPGVLYLIGLEASSNFNAVAVIDPVLEPDPDNPDITIEYPNAIANPNPLPLMAGITPEALVAQGIDPQPFIDLGFFDSPSGEPPPPPSDGGGGSTPPPSDGGGGSSPPPGDGGGGSSPPPGDGGSAPPPSPAPKYWCSPGFWLKNATSFGAGAWPPSEHVYYDYNSTAGQLAGCPVATGNPTLLQVLQNPKAYFSTQLKGTGFNCVGDYLSRKSGLMGTMADNNGVCSIDQFGRNMQ